MPSTIDLPPTPRQMQALQLLAQGHLAKQAGTLMTPPITPKAVNRHLHRVQMRLGARSLPQTLHRAYSRGLLAAPAPSKTGPLLTSRRRTVLELMAYDGCSVSEVGSRLWMSQWSVYNHLAHINRLLEASNYHHAVSLAIASGDLVI